MGNGHGEATGVTHPERVRGNKKNKKCVSCMFAILLAQSTLWMFPPPRFEPRRPLSRSCSPRRRAAFLRLPRARRRKMGYVQSSSVGGARFDGSRRYSKRNNQVGWTLPVKYNTFPRNSDPAVSTRMAFS